MDNLLITTIPLGLYSDLKSLKVLLVDTTEIISFLAD